MLDQKILEYAIVGIDAEIEKNEAAIKKGYKYLKQIENGEKPKTDKTANEIQIIIYDKKDEIEKLLKMKHDILWQLDTEF